MADWFEQNMEDASRQDTRTQDERIAAFDSPAGSTQYTGSSGRIDVRRGIDPGQVEAQLREMSGGLYHQSDLEGVLRNTGYQTGGVSLEQALANARENYAQRWAEPESGGGDGGGGQSAGNVRGGYGDYNYLQRPGYLQGEYKPPTWDKNFVAPTMAEVEQSPGYMTGLNAGNLALDRGASAKGSILSGGMLKARERYAQEYGQGFYGNEYNRRLGEYQQKYGEFADTASRDLSSRALNEGAYQSDVANNAGQFDRNYRTYFDNINFQRQLDVDKWGREMDLVDNALRAAGLKGAALPR